MSNILLLDSENFSRILYNPQEQDSPIVVVYFSASWCIPCKNMKPVFEQLASHFEKSSVKFAMVDIAQSPILAPKYGIKSVPTIAVFKESRLIKVMAGELSFAKAVETLNQIFCIN
ncbi:thioredoxin family protein [Providencia rettgeri]|uniref:thioredoxin family protein n=1 Tax=Providencia rettgeri TaxID=587 RepID=UPI0023AA372C|nr:thioredoxin family protein [Providencia rettgeri]